MLLKGVYQRLGVTLNCFSTKTNDFNQRTMCKAPVCWSKYTTGIHLHCPGLHFLLAHEIEESVLKSGVRNKFSKWM